MAIVIKGYTIKQIITFLLFCITSSLLFVPKPDYTTNPPASDKEMFAPELKRLNSVDKVLAYTDSLYSALKLPSFDTSGYVKIVSATVKRRFYHGLSCYSFSDNWICHVLGETCWSHISAIVNPDDILKYPEGLCSQQNIIFMEVLGRKGITTRTVGLGTAKGPGHFLSEVRYKNKWHLYDVDVEPNWKATVFNHESLQFLLQNKEELYKIYEGRIKREVIEKIIENTSYGVPSMFPAMKMLVFQRTMKIFTYLLPLTFLLLFIWLRSKQK